MSKKEEKQATLKDNLTTYFKGVKAEWSKISWPQKPQIISQTIVVTVIIIAFTVIIYLMDIIFKGILGIIPQ